MSVDDRSITETLAGYERLREFVDERVAEQVPDVDDAVRDAVGDLVPDVLSDTDLSQYLDVDDLDIDDKIVEGIENHMSYGFDMDSALENADPDAFIERADAGEFVRAALPALLEDAAVVSAIRKALAEVAEPVE